MRSTIECPWCSSMVILADDVCPECKHEVLPEHLNPVSQDSAPHVTNEDHTGLEGLSIEGMIAAKFRCSKCGDTECIVKEVAMNGTGFSKIFDIEYNHYLFVSCLNCGFVEVYNPDVLRGHKSGKLGTVMDLLFGG